MADLAYKLLEQRLARVESRLVQLMLHFGLDPHVKTYETPTVKAKQPETKETAP